MELCSVPLKPEGIFVAFDQRPSRFEDVYIAVFAGPRIDEG